jgi:hypothetical protein
MTSLWLGEAGVAGIPGRRQKRIDPHLDIVEWASAYFLALPHNEKKRAMPPPVSCVVVNRWWSIDGQNEEARPAARWADVIEYDRDRGTANLIWFGAKARVKSVSLKPRT